MRQIALGLPEVSERLSHGEPCFFVRDKRPLCYYHDDHNGDGRISLWCPVPFDVQEELLATASDRFFKPATSSSGVFSGWVALFLDVPSGVDWNEVRAFVEDAYRHVAPKRLVAKLDPR